MNRSILFCVLAATLCTMSAQVPEPGTPAGQTPTPPQTPQTTQPESWPTAEGRKLYVRRVSAGISLSFNVLTLMKGGTTTIDETALLVGSATTAGTERFGPGITLQFGILERFALNLGLLRRRVSYVHNMDRLVGLDNTSTAADERQLTSTNESTEAYFWDLPALIRFYGKDHSERGHRWFAEVGATMRQVRSIRTTVNIINPDASTATNTTPANIAKKNLLGATAGFGAQLIDPLGIRVVPEVRYTRWMGSNFSNLSVGGRRDQIEGVISFTF